MKAPLKWKQRVRVATVCGLFALLLGAPSSNAFAQDIEQLGGDLTSSLPLSTLLELPSPNIRSDEMFSFHIEGHSEFHGSREGEKKDGKRVLGPFFNHTSCGGCHVKDGRGAISIPHNNIGSAMLLKVSLKGLNKRGEARDVPGVGEQLQDHTLTSGGRFNIRIKWRQLKGKYPDGSGYKLRKPQLTFDIPGFDEAKEIVSSLRMTPPVVGMGLLEAIPAETIIGLSDPNDANRDGISGRVRFVTNRENGRIEVGRFGFRANHPTVKQQSAAAFFNDMGMTNELFTKQGTQQEVSDEAMRKIVFYQQAGGVPPARDQSNPDVIAGKALFQQINCSGCHTMTLQTGASEVVEVANQTIHPFTDLLLHDMGRDLSDGRAEFAVSGREWRTSPLWGIGMHEELSDARPGFLHDGRARTLSEAILWHGGEAARSRNAFKRLSKVEREQLLKFLRTL